MADKVTELSENVGAVVEEFAEGLSTMGEDLGVIMESADFNYEGGYEDGYDHLTEGDYGYEPTYDDGGEMMYQDPEVYDAIGHLQEGLAQQAEENKRLHGTISQVVSRELAVAKLQESGLPDFTCERLLPALTGLTSDEMDELIEGEVEHVNYIVESIGGVHVFGHGGEQMSEEEIIQHETSQAQSRLDGLIDPDLVEDDE